MEQQRIFVTGGAGFIGSNFVSYLLQNMPYVHIVVFDKLTYAGNTQNLRALGKVQRLSFIQGDICDFPSVCRAMKDCNLLIHFAAETNVDRSISEPSAFVKTNIEGTFTLLEAARNLNVKRFIHVSTAEVYGNVNMFNETDSLPTEKSMVNPLSPYAASKASADSLALSYWNTYGLPIVITRSTNNYGPRQYREKQLPLFIENAFADQPIPIYGDGHNKRDWIYVDDHSCALLEILTAPKDLVLGEIFNIGTGEERSIMQNAEAVLDSLNRARSLISFVTDRAGHADRISVNTEKLRNRLGWFPHISFIEGLKRTINWYRSCKI